MVTGERRITGRTGSAPVEQVGERWPRRRDFGRQPEVGENLPDDSGVFDSGHGRQSNYAAARGGGVTYAGNQLWSLVGR